jgi:predicted O-methyltransferase YrrM
MLEKIGTPEFSHISRRNRDALVTLKFALAVNRNARVAEVGIGVGATTVEMAKMMDNQGELHLFDFDEAVTDLASDLDRLGFQNVHAHGNTPKLFDSYNWALGKLLLEVKAGNAAPFDFIYIDGAHNFPVDGLAVSISMQLLAPGGYLLMDDVDWSYSRSRSINFEDNLAVREFTAEQLATQQVQFVCDLFLEGNPEFARDHLGGTLSTQRALYRKVMR